MEPDDEIVGYAIIVDEEDFQKNVAHYGEKGNADNYDCGNPPASYPVVGVFIVSTYNGIRTMTEYYKPHKLPKAT